MANRFDVKLVPEPNRTNSLDELSETKPLVRIENEITPLPTISVSMYEKNKSRVSSRFLKTILQKKSIDIHRRATTTAALFSSDSQLKKTSSADSISKLESKPPISCPSSRMNVGTGLEVDEPDVYSTTQSNHYDTNPISITNKFLQELRLKRRELRAKSKNMPIDQRIAFNRRNNQRVILRAQDIFDVHFELPDDDNFAVLEPNLFTEEYQEKVRNEIFNELTRQRVKQYDKQSRQLLLGRGLFMFMTLLLIVMGLALIFVVIRLYTQADHSDARLPDDKFIPMIHDKTKNLY